MLKDCDDDDGDDNDKDAVANGDAGENKSPQSHDI
jgi:hypothetical protein